MTIPRLLAINALIRIGAAGSGQLFAFLLAARLSNQVGVGALLVGLIGAAFFVTELVGAPFAGGLADRVGQRLVLRWAPVFGMVSALVAATAALGSGSVPLLVAVLFLARLNEGASAALAVPTTLTLLSRATDGDRRRRTRVMGAFEATSLVGMIAGYVLVGVAWDQLGTGAFLLLPPLYGVAWLLVGHGGDQGAPRPSTATERPSVFAVLRRLASTPGNLAFGISWLAINAVVGLWIQQAPFLLSLPERSPTQALVGGFDGQQIGVIFAVWGSAFLAGIILWSLLAPGVERRRAMSVALVGMLGVVASLAWFNHGGPGFVIWIAVAFILVEAGFTPAAFAHLAELTEPIDASRGAGLGLYSVLLGAGQLAGNLLGGLFAARWQMDGVLGLTAMLAVVSLVGATRMGTQSGDPQRQPAKSAR